MTLAAAADGQGFALTNHFVAADHFELGCMVEIGAIWRLETGPNGGLSLCRAMVAR